MNVMVCQLYGNLIGIKRRLNVLNGGWAGYNRDCKSSSKVSFLFHTMR